MNSAIEQSASSIRLSVNETLTMYPSNSQMQNYVNGQTSGILDDAKDYTDGKLQNYVTQVQMESAIEQSADNINLSVSQRLTSYSTTSQMQSYVQGQTSDTLDDAKDYTDGQVATRPTTTTVQNMIDIGLEGITLSASTNGTRSTITLKSGSATISSAQINFTGLVTFSNLSTAGQTQINSDNLTTGTVKTNILIAGANNSDLYIANGSVQVRQSNDVYMSPILCFEPYQNGTDPVLWGRIRFRSKSDQDFASIRNTSNNLYIETFRGDQPRDGRVIINSWTYVNGRLQIDTVMTGNVTRNVSWRYSEELQAYVLVGGPAV